MKMPNGLHSDGSFLVFWVPVLLSLGLVFWAHHQLQRNGHIIRRHWNKFMQPYMLHKQKITYFLIFKTNKQAILSYWNALVEEASWPLVIKQAKYHCLAFWEAKARKLEFSAHTTVKPQISLPQHNLAPGLSFITLEYLLVFGKVTGSLCSSHFSHHPVR